MAGQGSQTVPGDVAHTGGVGETHLQLGQSVSSTQSQSTLPPVVLRNAFICSRGMSAVECRPASPGQIPTQNGKLW